MSKSVWQEIVRNNWWIFMPVLFVTFDYSCFKAFAVFIAS